MPENTPVLDCLTDMTAVSIAEGSLEAREHMLARLAALVAVGAPDASYLMNAGRGIRGRGHSGGRPGRARRDRSHCRDAAGPGRRGGITRALGFAVAVAEAEIEAMLAEAEAEAESEES